MAKDGPIALLCALALGAATILSPAQAASDDRDSLIATTLAVQTAMQQARDFMLRNDCKSAVAALEAQLPRINGNAAYLALLRDAYRGHIKALRLGGQEADAQRYLARLQVLDPGAALDGSLVRGSNAPAQTPPAAPTKPVVATASGPTAPAAPVKAETTARGKVEEDDDPFRPCHEEKHGKARALLARAESEFGSRRYLEAGTLFQQANQADAAVTTASLDRWAYCKLFRVTEQLKQPATGGPSLDDLEQETRQAMAMAPKIDFGKVLLAAIDQRKNSSGAKAGPAAVVKHTERDANGWARAETAHFRIFHTQPREVAEQAAQVAERTRAAVSDRWFAGSKEDWSSPCDIYLYATAQEYSKATGVSAELPGHSTMRNDGSRIISRRIDLHCEDPRNMLDAVLPHETTHVIIADQFPLIPRWADEGMAVLTEPRDRIDAHLHNLPVCRQDNKLFSVRQLLTMTDYPDRRYITAFYAESVSVVEFLTNEKGPAEFVAFLHDGQKVGYEPALRKHYGYGFDEAQNKWAQKAFPTKVAQGDR